MKLFVTLILLLGTLISHSQCEAPIVTNWHVQNDSTAFIDFLASENSSEYVIKVVSMYHENVNFNYENPESYFPIVLFSGSVTSGSNSISFDPTLVLSNNFIGISPDYYHYYYKIELATICSQDTTWTDNFYISKNSLFNEDGYSCQNMYYPLGLIYDHDDIYMDEPTTTDFTFEVSGDYIPEIIEDFSILLDIGHTFCGDLGIELISPLGSVVQLLDEPSLPNILSDKHGFSVLFQEGAADINNISSEVENVKGVFAPHENFDNFSGESPVGTWTIRITDYYWSDVGVLFGVCIDFNESICVASLEGNSFFDLNNNGVIDNDEPPYVYGLVSSNVGTGMVSNQEGNYYTCFSEGQVTVQIENPPLYHNVIPENYSFNIDNGDHIDAVDFILQPIPNMEDLAVDVFHVAPDRPGFDNVYYLNYSNLGTECIDDVMIEFSVDSLVEIVDVLGADDYAINGQLLQVNLGTLCPYESGTFEINILISTETQIGDELTYSATISPSTNDQNITDNNTDDISIVVGSFDPNDKTVDFEQIAPEFLADGKALEYIIRFQNTGNYYAENVVIRDPLDENLVPNSLLILDASHPMIASIHGNDLVFEFNEIILPSIEDDEAGSNGFVRYSLKPQSDFTFGEVIENTGYIFFDFNEPIVTNTVNTILYEEPDVSLSEYENSQLFTFPNPVNEILYLDGENSILVENYLLFDILGNQIRNDKVANNSIDFKEINNGIYLLKFFDQTGSMVSIKQVIVSK